MKGFLAETQKILADFLLMGSPLKSFEGCRAQRKGAYMNTTVFSIQDIKALVKPIAEKYKVKEVYLFGSYARGEADENSDLDFLVFGGEDFKLTMIFSLAEELRMILDKKVDVFEINEINQDSDFYKTIMKERLLVA